MKIVRKMFCLFYLVGRDQVNTMLLHKATRIIPVMMALIIWGCLSMPASAHTAWGGSSSQKAGSTTSTSSTTSAGGSTTGAATSACAPIEMYVLNILQLFNASATFLGCSATSTATTGTTTGGTTAGTGTGTV